MAKQYKARDRTVQKMSRDGLTEQNLHSHESKRISKKEAEVQYLTKGYDRGSVVNGNGRESGVNGNELGNDGSGNVIEKKSLNRKKRQRYKTVESEEYLEVSGAIDNQSVGGKISGINSDSVNMSVDGVNSVELSDNVNLRTKRNIDVREY